MIPSGWGPTRVELSKDGKDIYIISIRGLGAGPNGGKDFVKTKLGTYIGSVQLGSFQKVEVPSDDKLAEYTKLAIDNTFIETTVIDDGKNLLNIFLGNTNSMNRLKVFSLAVCY